MSFIDERTKGTNREVIGKILQSAYDNKLITREDCTTACKELENLAPQVYGGIEITYRADE
jgi:hypothetical protein